MGGVLLWERNDKISAICNDCWITFSNQKQVITEAQKKAFQHNIGVESQLFHRVLPVNKNFQENLLDAQSKFKIKSFQINPTLIPSAKPTLLNLRRSLTQGPIIVQSS